MGAKVGFKVNKQIIGSQPSVIVGVPHGSIDIDENGKYDVSEYAYANVAIPIKEEQEKSVEIVENNLTIVVEPDNNKTLSKVSIKTSIAEKGNILKNLLDGKKDARCLFYNYSGTSVDNLIQYNDTENVTNMKSMFYGCFNLEAIPHLNTDNVEDITEMFASCRKITTIPSLNTSKVTSMSYLFSNCSNLVDIPLLDTSKVRTINYAFQYCHALKVIPALDVSNVSSQYDLFRGSENLEEIHMFGMKFNFNISVSTKFTREALVEILNNLATVTTTKTLTMGATNLAKLTDEDKTIATNKGWTLA